MGWTATQSGLLMLPSALMTAFMMPLIGKMLEKGIPQPYLIAIGMISFFFYSLWGYKIITPDTGQSAFFWMLIVRGVGLGFLFIPITAMSLSSLKGVQIGQGAAFTGMMRQLGGSFGIALISTFVSRRNQLHRMDLVSKLDTNSPEVMNRVHSMQASFMHKGMDASTALKSAYQSLEYSITKQQTVLSYMDVFLYLGILFLIFVPVVMLIKSNKKGGKLDPSAMH
jgi:DHA2 family multidrug resistance protein